MMTIYRYDDGAWPNTLLLLYLSVSSLAVGYFFYRSSETGLAFIPIKILVTVYLAHLMVVSAYLVHECIHNTFFKSPRVNDYVGASLSWLLGAGYHPYEKLKEKHLRHHSERQDVLSLDYRKVLEENRTLWHLVQGLQWCHFPAAEVFSHCLNVFAPAVLDDNPRLRSRVFWVLVSRLVFFLALGFVDLSLMFAFILAEIMCFAVLGFMDAYQHTYEIKLSLEQKRQAPEHDRNYEEAHTFTNLISRRFPILNLLVLNFCYHNIHHWRSGEPWYRLPGLHQKKYTDHCPQFIPFARQLKNYHRYRTQRILSSSPSQAQAADIGAAGVSFLVGV